MKIFKLNDIDYVAAETLEEAIQYYAEQVSEGVVDEAFKEEFIEDPEELSEEGMNTLKLIDENENEYFKRITEIEKEFPKANRKYIHDLAMNEMPTFRQALEKQIAEGSEFPKFFATTEW